MTKRSRGREGLFQGLLGYLSLSLALMFHLLEKWQLWRTQPFPADNNLHHTHLTLLAYCFVQVFSLVQLLDLVKCIFFSGIKP